VSSVIHEVKDASPAPCAMIVLTGVASGQLRSYSSFVISDVIKHQFASAPHGSCIIGSMYTLKLLRTRLYEGLDQKLLLSQYSVKSLT